MKTIKTFRTISFETQISPKARKRSESPHEYCKVSGCREFTTGLKPYCIEHIENLPFVQDVLKYMDDPKIIRAEVGLHLGKTLERVVIELVRDQAQIWEAAKDMFTRVKTSRGWALRVCKAS